MANLIETQNENESGVITGSYPAIKPVSFSEAVEYSLPGWGRKSSPHCNTVRSADYCATCHKVEPHYYHCFNWDCPECYPWAASRAATRAADHLHGSYMAHRKAGIHPGYLNHIELSVPPSEYSEFDEKGYKKRATEYAKQIGVSGGTIDFHPYRVKPEYQVLIQKKLREQKKLLIKGLGKKEGKKAWKASRKGKGYWKDIQEDILGLGLPKEYVRFSPHYHVIGYFRLKQKSSDFEKETKWTYKNISMSKGRGQEDKDSIKRIMSYLFTHHFVNKNRLAVSYFGVAHSSVICKKTHWENEDKHCECSSPMYKIPIDNQDQVLSIRDGTYRPVINMFSRISRVKTITHHYYLRNKESDQDQQVQKEIDSERVRSWLKDRPVKDVQKPVREFVPYRITVNDNVALRVACKYSINSGHIL